MLTLSALASGIETDVPVAFRAGDRELSAGNYSFNITDRKDENRVLSEVWIPMEEGYQVGVLDGAQAHVLVHVVPRASEKLSPEETFVQTCQVCHGHEGRGNVAADKFFQQKLPRLNSAFVQSKSDAELREIITKGRGGMDPVRQQQPNGVRHTLSAIAVDPLIAYLRTLASKS